MSSMNVSWIYRHLPFKTKHFVIAPLIDYSWRQINTSSYFFDTIISLTMAVRVFPTLPYNQKHNIALTTATE